MLGMLIRYLVLFFLGFVDIAHAVEPSKLPVELAIGPPKAGSTYSFDANIAEQLAYSVNVNFYIREPNKYFSFLDKETPEMVERLSKILRADATEDRGIPAKFHVQITRSADGRLIVNEVVNQPKTLATYMGRYAPLVSATLTPGAYRVHFTYLEGAPELSTLRAKITLNRAHHGK